MHVFDKNIKDLGLIIEEPPVAVANYVPYKIVENLVYISGQAPSQNGKIIYTGKVGDKISDEDKQTLINLTPASYIGLAPNLVDLI